MCSAAVSHLKLLIPKLDFEAKTPVFTLFLYKSTCFFSVLRYRRVSGPFIANQGRSCRYLCVCVYTHTHTHRKKGPREWDFSQFSRRRPFICLDRHTPSGQSRVYRVMQLRTDGVYCRESAGTGLVNLKVVPNRCCRGSSPWANQYAPLFPIPTIGMKWAC